MNSILDNAIQSIQLGVEDYQSADKYMVHLIPRKPSPPHEMKSNPHESTLRCWCKPKQDPDEPTVIVHNDPN